MCFCVENDLVKGEYVRRRKEKVEILERLGLHSSCISSDHRLMDKGDLPARSFPCCLARAAGLH